MDEKEHLFPTVIHSHATTWHDGGVAALLKDGSIVALASERVGDRYRHSWNSRLAYEHLQEQLSPALFDIASDRNNFKDPAEGLENTGHHLYHAASTFYGSPFSEAAVLVIDGQGPEGGKRASTTIWKGEGDRLTLLDAPHLAEGDFAPQSIGHFYTAIGAMAGMQELHEEGKTMGLAPYGRPSPYIDFLRKYAHTNPDGSYDIDPNFTIGVFGNTFGPKFFGWSPTPQDAQRVWDEFMELRGKPLRKANEPVSQVDMDIAYAGQIVLEEVVLGVARRTKELARTENLCFAGGVALNSVVNGRVLRSGVFQNLFVFPAAGDDGQAIGKLFHDVHTSGIPVNTTTETAYYGPEYSREQVAEAIDKYKDRTEVLDTKRQDVDDAVAERLLRGFVVGMFQGRSELGPRALGHRSILADPRKRELRDHINARVKHREWYRPLAPVVAEEDANVYFDLDRPSPFMLLVAMVHEDKKGMIPATTHVDGSARVQTINPSQDERFYRLVKRFGEVSGVPVLLNTSFNRRGEPIVETPEDALEAFVNMDLDALVLEDRLLVKK